MSAIEHLTGHAVVILPSSIQACTVLVWSTPRPLSSYWHSCREGDACPTRTISMPVEAVAWAHHPPPHILIDNGGRSPLTVLLDPPTVLSVLPPPVLPPMLQQVANPLALQSLLRKRGTSGPTLMLVGNSMASN